MKIVKRILTMLALAIFSLFALSVPLTQTAYAVDQDACDIAGYNDPLICGHDNVDNQKELMNRIRSILNTVYIWVGITAVIFIIIGGVYYMISIGNAEKIKTARFTIIYAIIGLIVTLGAFAITNLVINAVEGNTNLSASAPSHSEETAIICA